MNIFDFFSMKRENKKISMITCYDYWSAQIINETDIDCILVGDSLGMVMHGHNSTLPVSTELMALHTQAVVKGAPNKFIVGDMPFLSYRKSIDHNMNAVEKIMQAGANAIKLEGLEGNEELINHIVQSGVPVMGHLGLTPQSVHQLGGFKVQAKDQKAANLLLEQAQRLQNVGAFSVVLECVPSSVARMVSESLTIPTIGIGAGPDTNGQVLVLQDMLGMNDNFKPKFLKEYLNGKELLTSAINQYNTEVKSLEFPTIEESYE